MAALFEPQPQSDGEPRLLTVAEYVALGETEPGYTELQEGRLLMAPSPLPAHNMVSLSLAMQLRPQLPPDYVVIQDMDIDLELAPRSRPGFVRRPDLIVAHRAGFQRTQRTRSLIRAAEVVLVVEIVSPTSARMDTKVKHGEYADAGIPHYWIIDIEEPPSLVACDLGEHGYKNASPAQHRFTTEAPFPIELDLDNLFM